MSRPIHGGNLNWAASIAGCPTSLILDFSASINPLGPPACALEAIVKGLKAIKAYPDPDYTELREALAEWHQLSPEWILPGNGAAELLTWAGWELSQQEVTYLMTPAFADYWRALKTFASVVKPFSLDLMTGEWEIPLTSPEKAGLLLNNPHNPSGRLFSREVILPYLEKFSLVVVDEAFMDFLPPPQQPSLIAWLKDYPNLVILRSLTKFYSLPGLRLGYAIAHPDRLKRWQKWRDPWAVNILAVYAALAAIQDKEFQQQTWDWLIPTRNQLFNSLDSFKQLKPLPSLANFLLVKTDSPSSQLQKQLLQQHQILIRDCLSFPELGDNYFRIAILSAEKNQRLITALKREVGQAEEKCQ